MTRAASDDGLAFTRGRVAILLPYALVLWALAWTTIRFRGPHGAFVGVTGVVTYLSVIPATMLINWLHLKLANLPKREIVNAVAITLAAATTLDGTFFWFFPEVYGNDPEVLRHGAAFIIWAGAVAFWLAFVTRLSASRDRDIHQPAEL
jgi:hypothetical protein